jgi:hypothetical protein
MIKFTKIVTAAAVALTVSACSGNDTPDSGQVTETQMDDVDVIDGTISDDMVDVDTIKEVDATGTETDDSSDKKEETESLEEADSSDEAAE